MRKRPKRRSNPELLLLTNPLGKRARRAYERFHWRGPARTSRVSVPKGINAKHLVRIGSLDEVSYSTSADSERSKISRRWVHGFRNRPHLCTTPEGDVLIIFGGGLKVTPRGIEG